MSVARVMFIDATEAATGPASKTGTFGRVTCESHREIGPRTATARASIDARDRAVGAGEDRTHPIDASSAPSIARALRERDPSLSAVCILSIATGDPGKRMHWLDAEHACGWIEPAVSRANDDIGFDIAPDIYEIARRCDAALARGFVAADAVLLGCVDDELPRLSWGSQPAFAARHAASNDREIGLYAIVDNAESLRFAIDAGVTTVQLRVKRPVDADARWEAMLRNELADCVVAARKGSAELVVNDHWRLAAELGVGSVHLGQEDLLALGDADRAALTASGVRLGVSSHSVWELCRARSLDLRYIACGPVWPTTTKAMPWRAQGPDNLSWWCRNAAAPVVAIGGILEPAQAYLAALSGADGVCLVRALGDDPGKVVPGFRDAFDRGRNDRSIIDAPVERWPHPTLPSPDAG